MLRQQTAVLHPEHLYNAMDHHYKMMTVSSIIYTIFTCITWYCGLYFYTLCMLIHSATMCIVKTVDKIVKTTDLSAHATVLYGNSVHDWVMSGQWCLDSAWCYLGQLWYTCNVIIMYVIKIVESLCDHYVKWKIVVKFLSKVSYKLCIT